MSYASKAASMSAFIFPGSGHLYLKHRVRGIIFIAIAGVGLVMMMGAAFGIALDIAKDIEEGRVAMDMELMRTLIRESMGIYQEPELQGAKYATVGSWLISTLDAYREGKKKDKAEA